MPASRIRTSLCKVQPGKGWAEAPCREQPPHEVALWGGASSKSPPAPSSHPVKEAEHRRGAAPAGAQTQAPRWLASASATCPGLASRQGPEPGPQVPATGEAGLGEHGCGRQRKGRSTGAPGTTPGPTVQAASSTRAPTTATRGGAGPLAPNQELIPGLCPGQQRKGGGRPRARQHLPHCPPQVRPEEPYRGQHPGAGLPVQGAVCDEAPWGEQAADALSRHFCSPR